MENTNIPSDKELLEAYMQGWEDCGILGELEFSVPSKYSPKLLKKAYTFGFYDFVDSGEFPGIDGTTNKEIIEKIKRI